MFDVGFGGFFDAMTVLFPILFILVAGMIVVTLVKGIFRFHRNNQSPRLSVAARLVGKRQSYHRSSGQDMGFTDYYLTFEVESGDRMEFEVEGEEYGLLAEGDRGILNFQGTRYLGFERKT
jgi:hypothetical protein